MFLGLFQTTPNFRCLFSIVVLQFGRNGGSRKALPPGALKYMYVPCQSFAMFFVRQSCF